MMKKNTVIASDTPDISNVLGCTIITPRVTSHLFCRAEGIVLAVITIIISCAAFFVMYFKLLFVSYCSGNRFDVNRGMRIKKISEFVLIMVICTVIGMIDVHPALSADQTAGDSLPFAAAICVSKANGMAKKGKIHQAVTILENFRKKQENIDEETARKMGYSHYYIDFLLGNYYLILSSKTKLSELHIKKQYIKKAKALYKQAVKKKPSLSPAWLNLAKCCYETGNMAMAARAFVKGYETGKNKRGKYLYYASICFSDAGDKKNALKYSVLLTRTYPLNPKWWKTLSNFYLSCNDLKHGLESLISYGFLTPLKNEEMSLAADLYLSLGIPSRAAFYYEKLLRKNMNKKMINKIVYAYMETCQAKKALKWINKWLALYKSDKTMLRKKAAIQAIINFDNLSASIK